MRVFESSRVVGSRSDESIRLRRKKVEEVAQAHALQDRARRAATAMARADGDVKAEEAVQAKKERFRARRAAAATARADI